MKYDVIGFAREELDKHLEILGVDADISLGLFDDFDIEMTVEEPLFDDAIAITIKDKKGYIAGSNERSVLLGVYRLLSEWGISWVRPGKNGTHYPEKCEALDVKILEKADMRHRTMCIEGAVSIENVIDMIQWLPKVGFNGYYIQFSLPYEFFERWYSHRHNPLREEKGVFTPEQAEKYHQIMIHEIKKRGLILNTMGHGWHCTAFGVTDHGWYKVDPDSIPQEYKDICALVNGKREVWTGAPLATQLCYTKPEVKEKMVNAVVEYVKNHPEAEVVHFWLGDYFNNTCECPECSKYTHSDNYIRMVNGITDELAKLNLDTKIVFGLCYNTSHPPKIEKIKNHKNTLFLFAPITRSFAESFPDGFSKTEIPEYKVNQFDLTYGKTASVDDNLAYLHAWKKVYTGDTVDFDYHLMWDHIIDAGGEGIARVLYNDIKNLDSLGMNGYISCQLQRNAFPTSIAMTTMAKTLWNTKSDFDTIRKELYTATFGEDAADELCTYFETLSRIFDIGKIRGHREFDRDEFKKEMYTAIKAMDDISCLIESHKNITDACRKDSWNFLEYHRKIYTIVARAIIEMLDYNDEEGKKLIEKAQMIVWENEDKLQAVLDSMYFYRMTRQRITVNKVSEFTVI